MLLVNNYSNVHYRCKLVITLMCSFIKGLMNGYFNDIISTINVIINVDNNVQH